MAWKSWRPLLSMFFLWAMPTNEIKNILICPQIVLPLAVCSLDQPQWALCIQLLNMQSLLLWEVLSLLWTSHWIKLCWFSWWVTCSLRTEMIAEEPEGKSVSLTAKTLFGSVDLSNLRMQLLITELLRTICLTVLFVSQCNAGALQISHSLRNQKHWITKEPEGKKCFTEKRFFWSVPKQFSDGITHHWIVKDNLFNSTFCITMQCRGITNFLFTMEPEAPNHWVNLKLLIHWGPSHEGNTAKKHGSSTLTIQ